MKLYKHQEQALQLLKANNEFALLMEQGTGKTIPTLLAIYDKASQGLIKNALIIAPKAVCGSWYRDIDKMALNVKETLLKTCTIINYDKVWRGNTYNKVWDCIVLDESHKIKNRTSKRGAFLLELSRKAKYKYILTGTLINNAKLEDSWSQFAFLHNWKKGRSVYATLFNNMSYYDFLERYAYLNQFYTPYKYKNVDEVQEIIRRHSYRVLKVDCLDLPDKLPNEVYEIENVEKKLYKEMLKNNTAEEHGVLAENSLTRLGKLRQICSGFIKNENEVVTLKCEKLNAVKDFIEENEKKLVIFAEFKYSIKNISELLERMKVSYVVLDGEQKNKSIWRQFQDDETVQVIICQYASGNAGIDLYSADTIIFYEPTLSSNVLEQAKDRIHRIGQISKCSYIHFITKGTIEEHIFNNLEKYCDFNKAMFDDYLKGANNGR